jgi:hypothetical protein
MLHTNQAIREHLIKFLSWEDAHCGFDRAVDDFPPHLRGVVPAGLPYSAWQLVEHLRIAQRDILEFSRDPSYTERNWPDDYWPNEAQPPNDAAWDNSVAAFRADRAEFGSLLSNPNLDLLKPVPTGAGQTLLRELLLAADHNAYHIGQLVYVRRLLGAWTE